MTYRLDNVRNEKTRRIAPAGFVFLEI